MKAKRFVAGYIKNFATLCGQAAGRAGRGARKVVR